MTDLYPITAIIMFFGLIQNARIHDPSINSLFFVFYLICYLFFLKDNNPLKFNKKVASSILAFSFLFCWMGSTSPYFFKFGIISFSIDSLFATIEIVAKMIIVLLLIKVITYSSNPSEWAALLSGLGFKDFLLSISVAFNLIPFLKNIFYDFKRRVFYKNVGYMKRFILLLRLPYVFAAYCLVYANDVYKAYFSRGFEEEPPKYAKLKKPDRINSTIMLTMIVLIFITFLK